MQRDFFDNHLGVDMKPAHFPPAIATDIAVLVSTETFAAKQLVKQQSVRKRYSQTGTYFGIRPVKLCNGRLGWPAEFIKKSVEGGAV